MQNIYTDVKISPKQERHRCPILIGYLIVVCTQIGSTCIKKLRSNHLYLISFEKTCTVVTCFACVCFNANLGNSKCKWMVE